MPEIMCRKSCAGNHVPEIACSSLRVITKHRPTRRNDHCGKPLHPCLGDPLPSPTQMVFRILNHRSKILACIFNFIGLREQRILADAITKVTERLVFLAICFKECHDLHDLGDDFFKGNEVFVDKGKPVA